MQATRRSPCFVAYTRWGTDEIRIARSCQEDKILKPRCNGHEQVLVVHKQSILTDSGHECSWGTD